MSLYHHPFSFSREANVVWAREELDVPYELRFGDILKGAQKAPDIVALADGFIVETNSSPSPWASLNSTHRACSTATAWSYASAPRSSAMRVRSRPTERSALGRDRRLASTPSAQARSSAV